MTGNQWPSRSDLEPIAQAQEAMTDDYQDHCRHCGLAIRSTDAVDWVHTERPARHLHRCQIPGFPYGYEAIPTFDDDPCDCWACLQFGQRNAQTKGMP